MMQQHRQAKQIFKMKVHQITETGMLDGILAKARSVLQTDSGSNVSANPQQRSAQLNAFNEEIQRITSTLFPRIDRAISQGDKSTLTRTLSRAPQFVLTQLPNADALNAHLIDRAEDAVLRQVIARMARSFNSYDAAASRDVDKWVRIARSDPNMFINIVVDPSKMSEYGL